MAGTRTAPDFTTTANQRLITLHLIDASGDKSSSSIPVAVGAAAADIEAYAAAYQAATQASLWKITDQIIRVGDADPDNATTDQRNSNADGINMLFRNSTTSAVNSLRLLAPITDVFQGNQDIPLLSSTEMTTLILAALGLQTGYNFVQAQYTERRERKNNPVIR